MPLPPIKPHCGLRLPPDRYCLSACNYKLRAANQSKKMTKSALEGRSTIKTQIKGSSGGASGGASKRQTVMTPKNQVVTIPKPVIKFTTTAKTVTVDSKQGIASIGGTLDSSSDIKMEVDADNSTIGIIASSSSLQGSSSGNGSSAGIKREREEDEFEVVP